MKLVVPFSELPDRRSHTGRKLQAKRTFDGPSYIQKWRSTGAEMPLKISHSAADDAGRKWQKPLCLRISESTMEGGNNMLSDRGRDGRTRVSIGSMEERWA